MNEPRIFQQLNAVSDPTRARLLHVLEGRELTVGELVTVLQLPQSTVSRHLRILSDDAWVASRSEGTSRYYSLSSQLDAEAESLWELVRTAVAGGAEASQDAARARDVLSRRRTRSQEFFSSTAGRWDAVRAELFGEPETRALLALLDPNWVVGDLGCGTGRLAQTVAPFVSRVIAVDESADMLEAARARLTGVPTVEFRRGRLESLPVEGAALDVAILALVLHYVPDPAAALAEAARVLRPGGRLLVVDMVAHGRVEYRERMGHLWQGFGRAQLEEWLREAGFERVAWHALPPDPEAKGPLLFAAVSTIDAPRPSAPAPERTGL